MKNWNFLFISFCFALVIGLLQSYNFFQNYFSPVKEIQAQVKSEKKKVEVQKLLTALAQAQLEDFKSSVATILPNKINGTDLQSHQLRSLASVVKDGEPLDLSTVLLEKAKSEFRRGNFKASSKVLKELIQKYPSSPVIVDAYFFAAESFYMNGQSEECLDFVDQMMIQFPENELTGFIMLRMAQIMQSRNQGDEASEVYRIVINNFKGNKDLQKQAEKLLATVEM
jgi:TolA-binding protein